MIINGFEFAENAADEASPIELFAADSARAVRNLYIFNATQLRRFRAAKALLGYGRTSLHTGAVDRVCLTRQLPAGYPTPPDPDVNPEAEPYQWARAITRSEPCGVPTGVSTQGASEYVSYRMTVEYSALPFYVKPDSEVLAEAGPLAATADGPALPDEGDALRRGLYYSRYVSKFVEESTVLLTLREGFMRFLAKSKDDKTFVLPKGVPYTQSRCMVRYVWHEVPEDALPRKAIEASINTINNATFDVYAPGTLLFKSLSERLMQAPFGGRLWEVIYHFIWSPNVQTFALTTPDGDPLPPAQLGWNSVLRVRDDLSGGMANKLNGLAYESVIDATGAGRTPYRESDFSALFRPDQ